MRRLGHHFIYLSKLKLSFAAGSKWSFVCLTVLIGMSVLLGSSAAGVAIPQDAIRIRIVANSDASFDQQVKRDVQGQVAQEIESWGAMPATHDEARALIAAHLQDIQMVADRALDAWDVDYGAEVQLAEVPFPDKMFKGRKYEAGDYEALRITLGDGQGGNWWCVLFPPLCLTAATATEDKPVQQSAAVGSETSDAVNGKGDSSSRLVEVGQHQGADSNDTLQDAADMEKPKPRFFLWELLQKLGEFLKSLFA